MRRSRIFAGVFSVNNTLCSEDIPGNNQREVTKLRMKKLSALVFFAVASLMSTQAFALDTTELLDPGVVEIAPSIALHNIHDGKPGFASEMVVGYGVADFMTVQTILSASTVEGLAFPGFAFTVEAVFTPVDTKVFDMDFVIDFTYDSGLYIVTPSLEINFDTSDDMSGFGVYLTLGLPITSAYVDNDEEVKTDLGLDVGLGMYVGIADEHQLLLEGGFHTTYLAETLGKCEISGGYVGLGYNVTAFENFELTNEFRVDIPNQDYEEKDPTYMLVFGGVFDIPTRNSAVE